MDGQLDLGTIKTLPKHILFSDPSQDFVRVKVLNSSEAEAF
jgi:hypothetical protein